VRADVARRAVMIDGDAGHAPGTGRFAVDCRHPMAEQDLHPGRARCRLERPHQSAAG
jgi:hypothetical protein